MSSKGRQKRGRAEDGSDSENESPKQQDKKGKARAAGSGKRKAAAALSAHNGESSAAAQVGNPRFCKTWPTRPFIDTPSALPRLPPPPPTTPPHPTLSRASCLRPTRYPAPAVYRRRFHPSLACPAPPGTPSSLRSWSLMGASSAPLHMWPPTWPTSACAARRHAGTPAPIPPGHHACPVLYKSSTRTLFRLTKALTLLPVCPGPWLLTSGRSWSSHA